MKDIPVTLRVSRIRTFMPKTKINHGAWDKTEIEHEGIHNWCCLKLKECIEKGILDYNPETTKLSMIEIDYDKYGEGYSIYLDLDYCPFCGAKIEVEIIKDIVKKGKIVQNKEEKPCIVTYINSEHVEFEEIDVTEK